VALAFILAGIDRHDPAARGAYAFRPLLLPGLTLLWPVVLARWILGPAAPSSAAQCRHRRDHRRVWLALSVILPLMLAAAWGQRQHRLPEPPVQRIGTAQGVTP
jgi:hypothetical protein